MPGQSTMFVPLMSRNLARSALEREANRLVYSRCPANTNNLATPLLVVILYVAGMSEDIRHVCRKFNIRADSPLNVDQGQGYIISW